MDRSFLLVQFFACPCLTLWLEMFRFTRAKRDCFLRHTLKYAKESNVHLFSPIGLFPVKAHLCWALSCKLGYLVNFLHCPVHGMREFTLMWKRKSRENHSSCHLLFFFFFFFSLSTTGTQYIPPFEQNNSLCFASALELFCSLLL